MIFSYVHFIGIFRRFFRLGVLYFLCGMYFSYLVMISGSLLPAIVAHSFYNFIAMVYMRYSRRALES
jgi:membrane protease YdiL (CAAX protease family)